MKSALSVSLLVALIGCTDGKTKLEGDLPIQPGLDSGAIVITNATTTVAFGGSCDPRFQEIHVSFNGSSWYEASSIATTSSIDCSGIKRFSLSFDLSSPSVAANISFTAGVNATKYIYVRGKTQVGPTQMSTYSIVYAPPVSPGSADRIFLSGFSGTQDLASPTYKVEARVGVVATGSTLNSSSFRLNMGLQNQ